MGWYDLFSKFYDGSLERLYAEQRIAAAEALAVRPGSIVLDVPCGTGLSFEALAGRLDGGGRLLGVDRSRGMLDRARTKVEAGGYGNIRLLQRDVRDLGSADIEAVCDGSTRVDRLHVFLGMTAFEDFDGDFDKLWELLAPGGRAVIVDVHAPTPGFQGRMVNLIARADVRRRFWEPLERVAVDYQRIELPSLPEHGGTLFLASGRKPSDGGYPAGDSTRRAPG